MVEISRIHVDIHACIGIQLQLQFKNVYILVANHCYILPSIFSMECIAQMDTEVPIIICAYQNSFEALLQSEVLGCNYAASIRGVNLKMNGKEAIICCESYTEKTI